MEPLHGLVYTSRAKTIVDEESLVLLVSLAAQKNSRFGITGFLYFSNGHFTQYIEGERTRVTSLMRKLRRDHRHEVLFVAEQEDLRGRRFPTWAMRSIETKELQVIRAESVLANYLNFLNEYPGQLDRTINVVWKLINTVAVNLVELPPDSD